MLIPKFQSKKSRIVASCEITDIRIMSCDWQALGNNDDYDNITNGKVRCAIDPFRVCDDILLMTSKRDLGYLHVAHPHGKSIQLFNSAANSDCSKICNQDLTSYSWWFLRRKLLIDVLIRRSFPVFITWIEQSDDSRIISCWWVSHVHIDLKK